MTTGATTSRFLGMPPAQAAMLVITVATAFRLFFSTWLPILPDETYYLQWSRHLDASYLSKGPGIAYTIAAGTALFGPHNFGVRFFAVLLSAGTSWQLFLLARHWFDDVTGLISVLILSVVPLYAVGAVLMTIDPLSAFFWVWAAHLFSRAIRDDRLVDWLMTGFAVGSGFLAKYVNALELVAFLVFLLLVPVHRSRLLKFPFWAMLGVVLFCISPVWWWNRQHHWASVGQLSDRGHLNVPFDLHFSDFLGFLVAQAVVISPLLFLALLAAGARAVATRWKANSSAESEGELLLLLLFLSVFLLYSVLSWHIRPEPNWPAVSYLTLIVLLAAQWRKIFATGRGGIVPVTVFAFAWLETVFLHSSGVLPLPAKLDPMRRTVGWSETAARFDVLRREQQADILIADGYKEASVFSYYLPDQAFVYTVRHSPPANQFDLWQTYPTTAPHRALWVTYESSPAALRYQFNSITLLERMTISFRGAPLRSYTVYLCENKPDSVQNQPAAGKVDSVPVGSGR